MFQYQTGRFTGCVVLAFCTFVMDASPLTLSAAAQSRERAADTNITSTFSSVAASRVDGILDELELAHNYDVAEQLLTDLLDQLIAYAPDHEAEAFRIVSMHRRLVQQLGEADENVRRDLLPFFRSNPRLMGAIVFLVRPDVQSSADVYALLNQFRQVRGAHLEQYATLTAAICAVRDRPLSMRVNENFVHADSPLRIFDYYVSNESRMLFGIRNVPAELLMYVVDATASVEEMQWALNRYAGHTNVGQLFFEIKYDGRHLRSGTEKAVTRFGFNLPNILQHGGICADQAYFASCVGKAIGVPAAYTVGRSASTSHAWVGFLQTHRRSAWWNFDVGRYESYQGVRGTVRDPQSRRQIPDNEVSLLADFAFTSEEKRQRAAAMHDAAMRLRDIATDGSRFLPPIIEGADDHDDLLRLPNLDSQLNLIEQSIRQAAGYIPAWFSVRDMAVRRELSIEQMRAWADLTYRLCGDRYPYFHYEVVVPMIESIDDVELQNQFWNRAFNGFQIRHDLAAGIRMRQAAMWEGAGDLRRAGQCYEDVILRYANHGHFVIDALHRTENILYLAGRSHAILQLYEQTWRRTKRPQRMAQQYLRQSNWYRVGSRYAQLLRQAGRMHEADRVATQLR